MHIRPIVVVFLVVLAAATARADVIVLNNGRKLEGRVDS